MKALIIDNDENICSNLCDFLEIKGFDCLKCDSVPDAINLIQKEWRQINIIFLDIKFPEDDFGGFAIKRVLNGLEKKIPTIFMTALPLAPLYRDSRELGSVALLSKPFELDSIERALRKAINFKEISDTKEIKPIASLGLYLEGEIYHYVMSSTVTVGRNLHCNIVIPSYFEYASHLHCTFVRIYEEKAGALHSFYRLVDGSFDKSSSNGVFVNEARLQTKTCDLKDADTIKIPLYRHKGELRFASLYYELLDKANTQDAKSTLV